jgi:hypothetical protein
MRDYLASAVFFALAAYFEWDLSMERLAVPVSFALLGVLYWIAGGGLDLSRLKESLSWPLALAWAPFYMFSAAAGDMLLNNLAVFALVLWLFALTMAEWRSGAKERRKKREKTENSEPAETGIALPARPSPARASAPSMDGCAALDKALSDMGIGARAVRRIDGPWAVSYAVGLEPGERISRLRGNLEDLGLRLGARARLSVEGGALFVSLDKKGARAPARFSELLQNGDFMGSPLQAPIGVDMDGRLVAEAIGSLPHLLVTGKSGSGKTVFLRCLVLGLAIKNSPSRIGFLLCDGKGAELAELAGLPHLVSPLASRLDDIKAAVARADDFLRWRQEGGAGPSLVLVIDEANAVMAEAGGELRGQLERLSNLGRSLGVCLVLASQRPDKNAIDGRIQANFSRLALQVADKDESRRAIGAPGAEALPGRGALLYRRSGGEPVPLQGLYITASDAGLLAGDLAARWEGLPRWGGDEYSFTDEYSSPEGLEAPPPPSRGGCSAACSEYAEYAKDEYSAESGHSSGQAGLGGDPVEYSEYSEYSSPDPARPAETETDPGEGLALPPALPRGAEGGRAWAPMGDKKARALALARARPDLSEKEIGEIVGLSQSTISRLKLRH